MTMILYCLLHIVFHGISNARIQESRVWSSRISRLATGVAFRAFNKLKWTDKERRFPRLKKAVDTKGVQRERDVQTVEVEAERIGARRKEERQRIKRSVETSGISRLHGFVEPPCYYTDYIFKCAYPVAGERERCSASILVPATLPSPSPPSSSSSFSAPATSTIRRILSIFSRLHGFYDTFVACSPMTTYFKKPPLRCPFISRKRDAQEWLSREGKARDARRNPGEFPVHFHLSFVCASAWEYLNF